jgi:hypothetical protein
LVLDPDGPDDLPATDDDDFRLAPASPGIDAGDNAAVAPGVTTDLDGNARFVDDPASPDTGQGRAPLVDMGPYEFQGDPAGCPADLTGDGVVDVQDMVELIVAWGACRCTADLDGDGEVDVPDLVQLILAWGDCPA